MVVDGIKILSNVISSQNEFHAKYGGIVRKSRAKTCRINIVCDSGGAASAGVACQAIDAFAVTNRRSGWLAVELTCQQLKTLPVVIETLDQREPFTRTCMLIFEHPDLAAYFPDRLRRTYVDDVYYFTNTVMKF